EWILRNLRTQLNAPSTPEEHRNNLRLVLQALNPNSDLTNARERLDAQQQAALEAQGPFAVPFLTNRWSNLSSQRREDHRDIFLRIAGQSADGTAQGDQRLNNLIEQWLSRTGSNAQQRNAELQALLERLTTPGQHLNQDTRLSLLVALARGAG